MTYNDAVQWAVDNLPIEFYDSYDDWLDAIKSEIQTPELFNSSDFNKQLQRVWENEVGDIKKTRQQLEQEEQEAKRIEEEQRRIDEIEEPETIEEPEVREPTAKEVEHELERNLPEESRSRDFMRQEQAGALSNVLSSLPKGTKISIPQTKGLPIELKPSVTFPKGITMTRPPLTPTVVRPPPVATAFRQSLATVAKSITGGAKKALGVVRGIFRI